MKIFRFFVKKIFLRKAILSISMLLLVLIANYTTFIAARSVLSTVQGYDEISCLNQEGTYIMNQDPDSDMDPDRMQKDNIQAIYDYLNKNFKYAFYAEGFMTGLSNKDNMEISLNYVNEAYYKLNPFKLSQGKELEFSEHFDANQEIPVLVGKGVSKTYPLGSVIRIEDSVLERPIQLKVQGVLEENAHHSNFYALNSKNYYNFSILIPVNEEFIKSSNIDLKLNGLMDLIILKSNKNEIKGLGEIIQKKLGFKMNFFSQKENYDYFKEYYLYSLKIIVTITIILILVITCLSIWNALVSVRLMLKDFTINLLVGLKYTKLQKILYGYFGIMYSINLIVLLLITIYNRYGCWIRKDSGFATYGFFGLIGMDWSALLIVLVSDVVVGMVIVQVMIRRIKKIPISLGVLQ